MSGPRPEDLRGEARRTFDRWRDLGMSEAAAMREVAEAGLIPRDRLDVLAERFEHLGNSPAVARRAALGRDGAGPGVRQANEAEGAGTDSLGRAAEVALARCMRHGMSEVDARAYLRLTVESTLLDLALKGPVGAASRARPAGRRVGGR